MDTIKDQVITRYCSVVIEKVDSKTHPIDCHHIVHSPLYGTYESGILSLPDQEHLDKNIIHWNKIGFDIYYI